MSLIHETDYGTPRSKVEKMVNVTIDGVAVTVPEGTSIMRAAAELGREIPKLCATDMVEAFGSCRLCLVEIQGRNGTPASCTTPVAEGMVVQTQTERLKRLRKGVMELYIWRSFSNGANGTAASVAVMLLGMASVLIGLSLWVRRRAVAA